MGHGVVFYLSALREALKTGSEREKPSGTPDGLAKKNQKKCLTNARAHDKLNEFAPDGANDLKENRNKGIGAKSSEKT